MAKGELMRGNRLHLFICLCWVLSACTQASEDEVSQPTTQETDVVVSPVALEEDIWAMPNDHQLVSLASPEVVFMVPEQWVVEESSAPCLVIGTEGTSSCEDDSIADSGIRVWRNFDASNCFTDKACTSAVLGDPENGDFVTLEILGGQDDLSLLDHVRLDPAEDLLFEEWEGQATDAVAGSVALVSETADGRSDVSVRVCLDPDDVPDGLCGDSSAAIGSCTEHISHISCARLSGTVLVVQGLLKNSEIQAALDVLGR